MIKVLMETLNLQRVFWTLCKQLLLAPHVDHLLKKLTPKGNKSSYRWPLHYK